MLKILHVTAAAERGGLEVILLNILTCLDRSRFVPEVLFLEDGPFVGEVRETGTKTHVIRAGRVREIVKGGKAIASVVELVRRRGVNIVHSHNAKAHIYGGLASGIARVPCLYHLHGVPKPGFSRDGVVSILSFLIRAKQTVAVSNYVAEAFKTSWRSGRQVVVVHNGVIQQAMASSMSTLTVRREFGIGDTAPLVVMASRLQRSKGVHVFLDAAARVVRECHETRFMVIGGTLFGLDVGYADELRRQVDRLALSPAVVFTGYRADVSRFVAEADIVVHSSIAPDSFPTVLLEAMAAGKPVVASDLGGPREIVERGVTGFLVPADQSDALSQSVCELLTDTALRLRMGRAGLERFQAEFQATTMTKRLEALYEDLDIGKQ